MLRKVFIILAWSGAIGAVTDAAITAFAAWHVLVSPDLGLQLSVDDHLKTHLPFLYWLKSVAYALAPDSFVDWLFNLPALAYFPFRILINLLFGWWMLKLATKLKA
ncbi:MAG: hypothetical protein AAFP97_11655 [Pseudomonadota bacterium]